MKFGVVFWVCSEVFDVVEFIWRKEEVGTEGVGIFILRRVGGFWGWLFRDYLFLRVFLGLYVNMCRECVWLCMCVCVWGDCCFGVGTRERFYRFFRIYCEVERRK